MHLPTRGDAAPQVGRQPTYPTGEGQQESLPVTPPPPLDPGVAEPPRKTLAQKLEHLFRVVHPRDRGEYSLEEVAEGIRRRGGPTISATYIWQLRKGLRDNPTKKHLEALSEFFGISPQYFFDDGVAEEVERELDLLVMLRDTGVRTIATRSVGLSPLGLAAVADMVEHVRRLEGLTNGNPEAGRSRRGRPPRDERSEQKDLSSASEPNDT